MRNRMLVTLSLTGLFVAAPLVAQESCGLEIDVMETLLVQLQVAAEAGDADGALTLRDELREQLLLVEDGCIGEETATVTLDGYFEAPDDSYTVSYPEDWLVSEYGEPMFEESLSFLFFSNDADLLATWGTGQTDSALSSGQQGIALQVGSPQALTPNAEPNADFESYMTAFVQNLLQAGITASTDVTYVTIQDRRAGQVDLSNELFAVAVTLIEFEPNTVYGLLIGVAAPGELAELRPIVDAVAETWTVE